MDNTKRNVVVFVAVMVFAGALGINWQHENTERQANCVASGQQWVDGDCK